MFVRCFQTYLKDESGHTVHEKVKTQSEEKICFDEVLFAK